MQDAYKSIDESLNPGAMANNIKFDIVKIEANDLEKVSSKKINEIFEGISGILVLGGFGLRGLLRRYLMKKRM